MCTYSRCFLVWKCRYSVWLRIPHAYHTRHCLITPPLEQRVLCGLGLGIECCAALTPFRLPRHAVLGAGSFKHGGHTLVIDGGDVRFLAVTLLVGLDQRREVFLQERHEHRGR